MFGNKQGDFNPQQMLKPIPKANNENPPGKVPGKLNPALMNMIQNKFSGGDAKTGQTPTNIKPENKEPIKKKEEPKISNDNNIAQFIEDKNEQEEENQVKEKEEIKEDNFKGQALPNPTGKDKLEILCNIVKSGGRNRFSFQSLT